MRRVLRALVALAVIGAVGLAAGAGWLWRDYQRALATPLALPAAGETLLFEPGTSLAALADDLVRRGVLPHPWYLRWLGREEGSAARLQAGEYRLDAGTTMRGLLDLLVSGRVVQHPFVIIEGWTAVQMLAALREAPHLEWDLPEAPQAALAEVLEPGLHPEGQFLPETYFYTRGMPASRLLVRAHRQLGAALESAWAGRLADLPYETPYDALIMASIVEKETGRAEERALIAGVFVRRLQRGMRLQTDPTVIYGMGERFDGNIRRADLAAETPYNTYVIDGLPPTPIALPGLAAIEAAARPAEGKALYFVARGDGSHEFSETLAAHNRAVRRYQLGGAR